MVVNRDAILGLRDRNIRIGFRRWRGRCRRRDDRGAVCFSLQAVKKKNNRKQRGETEKANQA